MHRISKNLDILNILLPLFSIFMIVTSCDKSDETPLDGKIRILLTDKPYPFENVKNAYVSLYKIELRKKDISGEENMDNGGGNGNPYLIVMDESKEFNLVNLQNGVTEELALVKIPAGTYDLVRMYMRDASIELEDGKIFDLKIPSGSSSGLKIFIKPEIVVEGGLTSELLLDINMNRSLVMKGNLKSIEGFNFNPVIRATNTSSAGRIEGVVTDDSEIVIEGVEVSLEHDEEIVNSANTDETGYFALLGVEQGTYTLLASKENYDPVQIDNVVVNAGNKTEVNVQLIKSEN